MADQSQAEQVHDANEHVEEEEIVNNNTEEEEEEDGTTIEIDEETAKAIAEVRAMLNYPIHSDVLSAEVPTLESELIATGAPVTIVMDPIKGRKVLATRKIQAGEILFTEEATAIALCRSPGTDAVYSMRDRASGRLICTLPEWTTVRIFRDTLTLNPKYNGQPEKAYKKITQLTAFGNPDHSLWEKLPEIPPGVLDSFHAPPLSSTSAAENGTADNGTHGDDDAEEDDMTPPPPSWLSMTEEEIKEVNRVPHRAQLLQAIAQGNGFVVPLPDEDSNWKRALLWPLLGRIALAEDRERLFDDPNPLQHVTGFFPLAALLNHSCDYNITYQGGIWEEGAPFPSFCYRALRDIEEGEECCSPYIPAGQEQQDDNMYESNPIEVPTEDSINGGPSNSNSNTNTGSSTSTKDTNETVNAANKRRYTLLLTYRFRCTCPKCLSELPSLKEHDPSTDPLSRHFPFGMGVDGLLKFYELGGSYPNLSVSTPPTSTLTVL